MACRFSTFVLTAAVGLGALSSSGACGDHPVVPGGTTTTSSSGIAGATPDAEGGGGAGGDASTGGGGGGLSTGGGSPAVLVGMLANGLRPDALPASRSAEVEAAASAYAAGARIAAVKTRWADADATTLTRHAELAQAGCAPAPCRPVALTLAVVDGALDGRPEGHAAMAWTSPGLEQAFDATLDEVFDAFGDELAVLALGGRVDRWVMLHADDEADLQAFLARAVERALERGREGLLVGVGVSGDGALATAGAAVGLRALGTATMTSLFPGMLQVAEGDPLPSPAAAALVLDALDAVEPGRPIALVEVGFPSAEELGSSEDAQALFYSSLFAALDSRRASFPVVVASRLHDLGADACEAEGEEVGEADAEVLAYRCSTGLRTSTDAAKPAWSVLLGGVAKLATGGTTPTP